MNHHAGSADKFNEQQMQWLQMIREYYQLFGADMNSLIDELNEKLVA